MKRFLAAIAVICVLTVSALAGDIPTLGSPQPAPREKSRTITRATGDIPSVPVAEQLSGDALTALLSALTFLTV